MSKSSDELRELQIDELDAVSGGLASTCPRYTWGPCPLPSPTPVPAPVLVHEPIHS